MNLEQIKQRIEKGRIQLSLGEKFSYYSLTVIFFLISLGCILGYLYHKDIDTLMIGLILLPIITLYYFVLKSELKLIQIKTANNPNINLKKLKGFHKAAEDVFYGGVPRYYGYRSKGIFLEEVEYYFIKDLVYMSVYGAPSGSSGVFYSIPILSVYRSMKLRREVKELLQKET